MECGVCLPGSQSVCTYLLIEMCVCCIKLGGFKLSDMYKMTLDNAHIRWSVKHPGAWRMMHIRSDICVKMDHLQSPKSRHSTIYTSNDFFYISVPTHVENIMFTFDLIGKLVYTLPIYWSSLLCKQQGLCVCWIQEQEVQSDKTCQAYSLQLLFWQ